MTHPDIAAQGIDGVVIEDAPVIVQVEACGEGSIEEPGLGEADGALLGAGAPAQAKEHLPAPAEEIVLGEVEGAEGAVLGAVAAANGEEAGRLLRHLDVDDDLVLGGARRRPRLHLVEVVQVAQLLLRPGELLGGEQVPLVHGDLAAQDLLLAAGVARDIDALDEDLGPFGDLEGDVDLPVRYVQGDLGIDVGGGAPDGAVHVADVLGAVAELGAGVDVIGLELNPTPDLLDGEDIVARDVHPAHPELRTLHHHDPDGDAGVLAVHLRLRGLHARLDVAVVVVEGDDPVHVLLELLPLDGSPQDEVLPLLREQDLLDLFGFDALRALDDDLLDRHLAPLDDPEAHRHVAVG